MTATWTELRDGFGVRITSDTPPVGQSVTVRNKAGGTSNVAIDRVIWAGKDKYTGEHVLLCTVRAGRGCPECRRLGEYCQKCLF